MRKHFRISMLAVAISAVLLLAGCGEGTGAEDTGNDGQVGGKSTTSTTSHTKASTAATSGNDTVGTADNNTRSTADANTARTSDGETAGTSGNIGNRMGDNLMGDIL